MSERPTTAICHYNATHIFVRDRDLCADLIGKSSLGDFIFLLIMGTEPSEAQRSVVEAAIVTLAEHGLTPSAIAARLTYMGAPESMQGAIAAGLLGVGDQFVGTTTQVAPLLVEIADASDPNRAAVEIVARIRAAKGLVPGVGQPHHKPDDPRPFALFDLADRLGVSGRYVQALRRLGEAVDQSFGRHVTLNAPAAVASLFLEIGIPIERMRGFLMISRCIGLVAHVVEEQEHPAGRSLWDAAAHAVDYASLQG